MAGVTSDATNIYIYDDTDASAGGDGSYSTADIFAVLGASGVDILRVDSGTGVPTYRWLKNLQIGDTGVGTATTTLSDTNVVWTFDAGKVLKTRSTQTTSWNCLLGTKIGSGNSASGKKGVHAYFTNISGANSVSIRGTVKMYGCCFQSTQTGGTQQFQVPAQTTGASEIVNCILGGFTSYVFGQSGGSVFNMFNVDITGDGIVSNVTSFFVDSASRLTLGGSPGASHIATSTPGIGIKDPIFFGSPVFSDLRWNSPAATDWVLVRPTFGGASSKFSGTGPVTAATGAHEYWVWDVKVVDRNGIAVANIPVKLTDADGNIQVNTVTNGFGQVTFGSGLSANCAVVADHYAAAGVYTIHHRSPFTVAINTGPSANTNYLARTYKYEWPGFATITTTSGTFEDISDIVPVEDQSGSPTTWVELTM